MNSPSAADIYYAGRLSVLLRWQNLVTERLMDLLQSRRVPPGVAAELADELGRLQQIMVQAKPPSTILSAHPQLLTVADELLASATELARGQREAALEAFDRAKQAMIVAEREMQRLGLVQTPAA